jgi:WD40 repeat protein
VARVFLSHASADDRLAGELRGWLIADGHEVFLDHDLRDGIGLGEEWQQRLYERLRWADAVVCVLTHAYRNSTWCAAEVGIAQAHGSRLLPLLAESGAEHPLLPPGRYQFALLVNDPVAARAALGEALRRVDAAGGLGWPEDRSPFPGLRPFEPDLHRVFFGRHAEVAALADLLRSLVTAADAAMVLVVGPSGCGKSSLVRGGLLPVMAGEPGWETLPAIVPGTDPVAGLTRAVAVGARLLGLDWSAAQVRDRLGHVDGLAAAADELVVAGEGRTRQLLLVVDQFEELLTLTTPAALERFARLLKAALGGPARVVATLRADFVGMLLASAELAELPTRSFMLRPLARSALPAVIEGPARLAGIGVDDGLVSRLVADTDTGEALPLLAFTLAQLADNVGRGDQLSMARYDQLGGVRGALIGQADAAVADALAASGRTREQVIAGLLRLVSVDEQGRPIRSRVYRDELPAPVGAELDAFVARRLLTTDTDRGRVVLGVAHEAFPSAWPPLYAAITAAASALRTRRAVEQAAADWDDDSRPPVQLWERGPLAAAVAGLGARLTTTVEHAPVQLPAGTPQERPRLADLLPGRRRVLVTDKVDLSSRARDFLQQSIRRDRRRRGRAVTVLSVLLILAVTAAGFALAQQGAAQDQKREAQEQQRIATARELIARAAATRDQDPLVALLLGIAAHTIHPDRESEGGLMGTLAASRYAGALSGHHTDLVSSVAFAPDGRTLASGAGGEDGKVILWDVSDRSQPVQLGEPLTGPGGFVNSMAFAPDGRTLATGGGGGTVVLWDVSERHQPNRLAEPLSGSTDAVSAVAFAPDGRTLASSGEDGTVILWGLTDRNHPNRLGEPLTGHTGFVDTLAFAPDGPATLAAAGEDGTVILWDVTDQSRPDRLGEPLITGTAGGTSMAFGPGGRTLVTAGEGGPVSVWDLTDRNQPDPLGKVTGTADEVDLVAFAPGGGTLVTAGLEGPVILWDLTVPDQPDRLGEPLIVDTSGVRSIAFAPDGNTLVTGMIDGTMVLWDVADRDQPVPLAEPLTGHADLVFSVTFTLDGRTVAATGDEGPVILWDVTDRDRPYRLGEPLNVDTDPVNTAAFAPDGRTLATGGLLGMVILWDLADRAHPHRLAEPLTGPGSTVTSIAFAPDGRTLAAGSETVILWDVTDPDQPDRLGEPLTGHTDLISSVAFAPDGRTLATAGFDGTVILWDVADQAHPDRLGEPLTVDTVPVNSVAFAPDGRTLATGSDNGPTILWDVTDRDRPNRLGESLTGHNSGVFSVAFAPDNRTLATAGLNGTVILWDVADRDRPFRLGEPLAGRGSSLYSVAFAPDGRTVATSSDRGPVILWDLAELNQTRDHFIQRACDLTGGGLSRDEWNRYVPGLPYQQTC